MGNVSQGKNVLKGAKQGCKIYAYTTIQQYETITMKENAVKSNQGKRK